MPMTTCRSTRPGGCDRSLGEFHPDFAYHEQPGAGHWWGNACVDWPPLFAFLEERTIPAPAEVRRIDFVTASPGVSHRAHWASIEAQLKVDGAQRGASRARRRDTGGSMARRKTSPGWRSTWAAPCPIPSPAGSFSIELDGQSMPGLSVGCHCLRTSDRRIWLVRSGGTWSAAALAGSAVPERPSSPGPVQGSVSQPASSSSVGTKGTAEENAWGLARARFDAETFWYRGNGSVDIVTDTTFLDPGRADEFRDRNVILYGHSESNAAWPVLLGKGPVQVRRGQVQIGQRTVSGDDLACLFIQPRPGSDRAVGRRRGRNRLGGPPIDRAAALLHLGRGLSRLPAAGVPRSWAEGSSGPDRRRLLRPGLGRRVGRICLARLNPRILPDRPGLGFPTRRAEGDRRLIAAGRELKLGRVLGQARQHRQASVRRAFAAQRLFLLEESLLGVIDLHQSIADRSGRVGPVGRLARGGGRELDVSPALGAVHVDDPLGRPDPVVLGCLRHLAVLAVQRSRAAIRPGRS